jgi:transposase-like protein
VCLNTTTPTHDNSTATAPIDEAIEDLESRGLEEQFALKEVAEKHGVDRSTLGRRWRGVTGPLDAGHAGRQVLNPQQELELVQYVEGLTNKGLPPTREMIRKFSSEVAHQQLSSGWVTRFINRHKIHLISSGPAPWIVRATWLVPSQNAVSTLSCCIERLPNSTLRLVIYTIWMRRAS